MDQILECCEGVIGIADDVIIHGTDDEDHDRNLHNFMHTACEHGLVFNGEKCEVKKDSVTFFGTVYDANGAHPDPKKVDAIHKVPPPHNKQQLQHFLGMVTHLSPFIPSLYTHYTTMGTAEKGLKVHVEPNIPGSLQPDQEIGLQGHHTPVL